jgi:hypothetical protein
MWKLQRQGTMRELQHKKSDMRRVTLKEQRYKIDVKKMKSKEWRERNCVGGTTHKL